MSALFFFFLLTVLHSVPKGEDTEKAQKQGGKQGEEGEQEKSDSWLSGTPTAAWSPGTASQLLQLWTFKYF